MKNFSIVIPAYNEEERIGGLLGSISKISYPEENYEVIVVNDGSTDSTSDIVKRYEFVNLIDLKKNIGRFDARKTGAEKAKFENVLFVDSRCEVYPEILNSLNNTQYDAVVGASLGVDNPNAFETFYSAIRRKVFPVISKMDIIVLDPKNFDRHPKGTGVFYAKMGVLEEMYKEFSKIDVNDDMSDDTKMLRIIAEKTTLVIDPSVKVINYSRTDFKKSITHLYKRGAKFIDYYFDVRKKFFWMAIVFPFIIIVSYLLFFLLNPASLLLKLGSLILADFFLAVFLARNSGEFIKIFYIAPLIVIVFYLGILRGIILKSISVISK